MCAPYDLRLTNVELRDFLDVSAEPFVLGYNIAPTQRLVTVNQENGRRVAQERKLRLTPSWSKDVKLAATMINVRSETAATKPAFRSR